MPENKYTSEEVLATFLDQLIVEKNGEEMDFKKRSAIRRELREKLEAEIDGALVDALTDEQVVELEKRMNDDMAEDELGEFLENTGVDYEAAVLRALDKVREEYLKGAGDLSMTEGAENVREA